MKKFLALVLALCLVASLGTAAFATSQTATATSSASQSESAEDTTTAEPVVTDAEEVPVAPEEFAFETFAEDGESTGALPEGAVQLFTLNEADELSEEDRASFLDFYQQAQAIEDKVVKYFFWLDAEEEYAEIPEGEYLAFNFACTGENVEVLVNGNETEVEQTSEDHYMAKLTEFGAVAILCDAEA